MTARARARSALGVSGPRARRIATALAATVLALGAAGACSQQGRSTVPPELRGTWRTEQAPYEKRYLEIRAERLVLGVVAPGQQLALETLEVRRVRHDASPEGGQVFRVRYRAPQGYDETMVLRYRAEPEPALRLAHRDALWRRVAP